MTLIALTSAPLGIQFHAASASLALLIGPFALLRGPRDGLHRALGAVWVLAMLGTAISSMFISQTPVLGRFSPIHILSVITLAGLFYALRAALRREFIAHGRAMRALYAQALIVPGVFTFLPGRRMNAVFGGGEDWALFAGVAALGAGGMALIWFHPRLSRALGLQGKGLRKIPLFFMREGR